MYREEKEFANFWSSRYASDTDYFIFENVINVLARSSAEELDGKISLLSCGGDVRLNEIRFCCRCQPLK